MGIEKNGEPPPEDEHNSSSNAHQGYRPDGTVSDNVFSPRWRKYKPFSELGFEPDPTLDAELIDDEESDEELIDDTNAVDEKAPEVNLEIEADIEHRKILIASGKAAELGWTATEWRQVTRKWSDMTKKSALQARGQDYERRVEWGDSLRHWGIDQFDPFFRDVYLLPDDVLDRAIRSFPEFDGFSDEEVRKMVATYREEDTDDPFNPN